ncbi:hypothetical protein QWZ10_19510 [Paracoccus cavernae]|uniref:HNH endonuclease n=1 Tax=Paracoccus cavernae TaxID=1571207 RepID=A0ABT8D9J6_9RHOB|nr:hypothetical protein [Paracoccus cavernae]
MRSASEIISDAEIIAVHANANFGDMTPREVVNDGVRKYAIGYSGGHTQQCILREHGLITKGKGYNADLTKKGKEYARAIDRDAKAEIARLTKELAETKAALGLAYETAAKVAQDKHDAAMKWAECYLKSFDGQTDSLLIAEEIRALAPDATAALEADRRRVRDEETKACAWCFDDDVRHPSKARAAILARLDQRKEGV